MQRRVVYFLILSAFLFLLSCKDDPASSTDTEKPTVSILYPANNSEIFAGNVVIKTDATDNDKIKEVTFYIDGDVLSTDATAPYSYKWNTIAKIGTHTIKVKAYDNNGNIGDSDVISVKVIENTAPTTSFTVSQYWGTTNTMFIFDASGSRDREENSTSLQVRWDWENDGIWDTDYAIAKIDSHKYSTIGEKTIKLEIKDSGNLQDSLIKTINLRVPETGIMTGNDGFKYKTVKIGDQWWMAENLKVSHYRNGEVIPKVTDNTVWSNLNTGAYCAYNNNNANKYTYGLLYNWYAIDDNRHIAPAGWHVPTDEEWQELEDYLIASGYNYDGTTSGDKTGKSLASQTDWDSSTHTGAVGNDLSKNNTSGFNAFPCGYRASNGPFLNMGGFWWSSTEYSSTFAWERSLNYNYSYFDRTYYNKHYGFSVRLIHD